ncbi:hypothetical protein VTG60DRAFT_970 [Thermothelomyces hinnuleus]
MESWDSISEAVIRTSPQQEPRKIYGSASPSFSGRFRRSFTHCRRRKHENAILANKQRQFTRWNSAKPWKESFASLCHCRRPSALGRGVLCIWTADPDGQMFRYVCTVQSMFGREAWVWCGIRGMFGIDSVHGVGAKVHLLQIVTVSYRYSTGHSGGRGERGEGSNMLPQPRGAWRHWSGTPLTAADRPTDFIPRSPNALGSC